MALPYEAGSGYWHVPRPKLGLTLVTFWWLSPGQCAQAVCGARPGHLEAARGPGPGKKGPMPSEGIRMVVNCIPDPLVSIFCLMLN